MIEMVGPVLARAPQPFPVPVRTMDAIHLAALEFIRAQKQSVQLASYDERLLCGSALSRNCRVEREPVSPLRTTAAVAVKQPGTLASKNRS